MNVNGRSYRTIWIGEDTGELTIIDQTALPHEFRTEVLPTVADVCRAIKDMLVRGAGLIGATAAWGVWVAARTAPREPDAFFHWMEDSLAALRATRPTASNLVWALERQARALHGLTGDDAVAAARAEAQAIADEDAEFCRRIGEHGRELIVALAERK